MTQGLYSETKANFVSIKNAFSCKYQKTQPTGASNKGQSLLDYVKSGYIQSPLVRNTNDVKVETVVPVGATAPGMTSHNPSKGRKHMEARKWAWEAVFF